MLAIGILIEALLFCFIFPPLFGLLKDLDKILVGVLIMDSVIVSPVFVIGLGTVTFYKDKFVYKYCLFSKKRQMYYKDITKVFIDYENHPSGFKSGVSKHIYILKEDKIKVSFYISFGIIKQLVARVKNANFEINVDTSWHMPKRHKILVYNYLTQQTDKDLIDSFIIKHIKKSYVVFANNLLNFEDSVKAITAENKLNDYEIIFLSVSKIEREKVLNLININNKIYYRFIKASETQINNLNYVKSVALSEDVCLVKN
ncbi:MAG: hypothetical protein J6B04_02860 [Clostridia bacterium]|nr:hypothetical protein [Clostridia bacterium]